MTQKLYGQISVKRLRGKINKVPSEGAGGPLQEKTIYPSHERKVYAPNEEFYGFSVVTAEPVPRQPFADVSIFAGSSPTPAQFVENVNLVVDTEVLVPLTYQVQSVEGATYGFAMSSGWWVSQNKGVSSSYAMCKVLFNLEEETTVTLKCINYAQAGYDYGLISEVDTMLALSNTADSEGVLKSFVDSNSSSAVDVPVTIPAGEHFLCVKYRKNSANDKNNDTLKFAVTL